MKLKQKYLKTHQPNPLLTKIKSISKTFYAQFSNPSLILKTVKNCIYQTLTYQKRVKILEKISEKYDSEDQAISIKEFYNKFQKIDVDSWNFQYASDGCIADKIQKFSNSCNSQLEGECACFVVERACQILQKKQNLSYFPYQNSYTDPYNLYTYLQKYSTLNIVSMKQHMSSLTYLKKLRQSIDKNQIPLILIVHASQGKEHHWVICVGYRKIKSGSKQQQQNVQEDIELQSSSLPEQEELYEYAIYDYQNKHEGIRIVPARELTYFCNVPIFGRLVLVVE